MIVPIELAKLRNLFGPLDADVRKRLLAVINRPSQRTWNDAFSIIIAYGSGHARDTLWQCVSAVDDTFPSVGPAIGRGSRKWSRIPTRDLLLKAIAHAARGLRDRAQQQQEKRT